MPRGTHPNSLANLKKGNRFTDKESARRAGRKGAAVSNAKQHQWRTIREIAEIVGNTKIKQKKLIDQLREIGVPDEDLTNNAVILAAVYRAAIHGDLKAVEKWERYIGQADTLLNADEGSLAELIDGLREPCIVVLDGNDAPDEAQGNK
ncbi:MAG: hypothetical protein IKU30_00705 [Clostridia bacterium]|nr:hypothetical protein [Clostridia bacterium]